MASGISSFDPNFQYLINDNYYCNNKKNISKLHNFENLNGKDRESHVVILVIEGIVILKFSFD